MLAFLIAFVPSIFVPSGERNYTDTLGRCSYSEAVKELHDGTILVECSQLRASRDGRATYDFRYRGFGPGIRFSGELRGDTLIVEEATLRNGERRDARGECRTFYANGEVSVVTCLVTAGSQHFAVNFVPSPFDKQS